MIETRTIEYLVDEMVYESFMVYNSLQSKPQPAVLIAHAWKGQDDFVRNKAKALAELGYVGFTTDVYGKGAHVKTNEEAFSLMAPLFVDRQLLRKRISSAYHSACEQSEINHSKIAAMGYCFGGLTVLELLRSGVPLKGAISFHGVLANRVADLVAELAKPSPDMQGSFLIFHGNKDPMVSPQDLQDLKAELSEKGIEWQLHEFGNAAHAFTNPEANDPESGLVYDALSDQRSWTHLESYLKEIF